MTLLTKVRTCLYNNFFLTLATNPIFAQIYISVLLIAWILGIEGSQFLARIAVCVIACTSICFYFLNEKSLRTFDLQTLSSKLWVRIAVGSFLNIFVAFLFLTPILRTHLGLQGIDFAIFSQVVDSIARLGSPMTTLVRMEDVNFFEHHFSPFLLLPGLLSKFGIPSYIVLSLIHGLVFTLSFVLFYLAQRTLNFSRTLSLAITVLLISNATIRQSVFWGIHDETFAVAFFSLAYWAWFSSRFWIMILALILAATTKETMALVSACFLAIVLWEECFTKRRFFKQSLSKTQLYFVQILTFCLFLYSFGYVFVQPYILGKNFDHFDKLANIKELLNGPSIDGKLELLKFLLIPVAFIPFLIPQYWHFTLPALSLLGMIIISKFDQMWSLMNYYGVIPSYILYFATVLVCYHNAKIKEFLKQPFVLVLLLSYNFSWSTERPMNPIRKLNSSNVLKSEQLSIISDDATVISSANPAIFLFRVKKLWRLYHANQSIPKEFDFVVLLKHEVFQPDSEMNEELKSLVNECYSDDRWVIYCNKHSSLKLQ